MTATNRPSLHVQIRFLRLSLREIRLELDELRELHRMGVREYPRRIAELRELFHAGHALLCRLEQERRTVRAT